MTVSSPMFWVCLGIGLLLIALIIFMFACFFMRRAPPPTAHHSSRSSRPMMPNERTRARKPSALTAIVSSANRASIPMVSGPAASESLDSVWIPRHQLSRLDEQRPYEALLAKNDALLDSRTQIKRHMGQPSYVTTHYTPPRTTLTRPMVPSASTDEEVLT